MKVIEVFLVIVALFVPATLLDPSEDTPKWSATLRRADGTVAVGTVTIEKLKGKKMKVSGKLENLKSGKYVGVLYQNRNVHSMCKRTGLPTKNSGTAFDLLGTARETGKDFWTVWGPVSMESGTGKEILTSYLFIYSMSSGYTSVLNALLNETNTMEAVACGEFRKITSTTTRTTKAPPKTTTTPLETTTTPPETTTTPSKMTTTPLKTTATPPKTTTTPPKTTTTPPKTTTTSPKTTTTPPKTTTTPPKTTTTPPRVVPKTTPLDDPKNSPTVSDEDDNLFERLIDKWHTFGILWVVFIAVLLVCCCWDRRCRCTRM